MFDDICVGHFFSLPVAILCGFLLGLGDSSFNTQVHNNCTHVLVFIDNNPVPAVCKTIDKNKI